MRQVFTFWICLVLAAILALPLRAQEAKKTEPATEQSTEKKKKEYEDFSKVIEDSKTYQGFFNLYQKKENLYCEIQPSQLDEPFLCMISIARGIATR